MGIMVTELWAFQFVQAILLYSKGQVTTSYTTDEEQKLDVPGMVICLPSRLDKEKTADLRLKESDTNILQVIF